MEKPKIIINGKEIDLKPVKARLWTTITKLNQERDNTLAIDALEKYCAVIAAAFGVTTDEVLDNLNIEDVMPIYFGVLGEIVRMFTAKLNKKNEVPEEVTTGEVATQA